MYVKKRCPICNSSTRIRKVGNLYQVVCVDNGHTMGCVPRPGKSLAVGDWNYASMERGHKCIVCRNTLNDTNFRLIEGVRSLVCDRCVK